MDSEGGKEIESDNNDERGTDERQMQTDEEEWETDE